MNTSVATEVEGLFAQLHLEGARADEQRASTGEARRSLEPERWIVLVVYERDGKGFVVARSNDVRRPRPASLSLRERQALGRALLGNSNKLIAYELGISASTVGVLLHRAARKLGCNSRVELIQRFHASLAEAHLAPQNPST
jgi:DNA-binding CsgD family transcriptional regulator